MDFILDHLAECDLTYLPRMFPKIAVDLVLGAQKKEKKAKGISEDAPTPKPGMLADELVELL